MTRHRLRKIALISIAVLVTVGVTLLFVYYALNHAVGNRYFSVYGQVLDRQTGQPIANATVDFKLSTRTNFGVPLIKGSDSRQKMVSATTDASGRFAIHNLNGRYLYLVRVDSAKYPQAPDPARVVQGIMYDVTGMTSPKPPQDPALPVKILLGP